MNEQKLKCDLCGEYIVNDYFVVYGQFHYHFICFYKHIKPQNYVLKKEKCALCGAEIEDCAFSFDGLNYHQNCFLEVVFGKSERHK